MEKTQFINATKRLPGQIRKVKNEKQGIVQPAVSL